MHMHNSDATSQPTIAHREEVLKLTERFDSALADLFMEIGHTIFLAGDVTRIATDQRLVDQAAEVSSHLEEVRRLLERTSDAAAQLRSRVRVAPWAFPAAELLPLHDLLEDGLQGLWPLLCSEERAVRLHKLAAGNASLRGTTRSLMAKLRASMDGLVALEDRFGALSDLLGLQSWPLDDAIESDDGDLGRVQL
jgi:hypothetical protein